MDDLDAALPEADIISAVTMATAPVIHGQHLKPGAHVDLIGAYLPTMREADPKPCAAPDGFSVTIAPASPLRATESHRWPKG